MTLSKLSLRNAKRQARDYLVYFVTTVIAAALIHSFNGLVFSQEIIRLSQSMATMPAIVIFASIVVVCIIGWLVSYTTSFILTRRSREMGLYILIGLENKQVAQLFFRENLAVGGVALALGILLGTLVYQMLRAAILALFGVPYRLGFAISPCALGLTLFYFMLIYLFAQLRCRKRICSMKIYDLIYFERQNEEAVIQSSGKRRKIFALSILLGAAGTALILCRSAVLGFLGAACIILFLFAFFASFASGVPAYFEKHPARKFQGQSVLVFRTLSAKLATICILMAVISILFTATLIAEGAGLTIGKLFQARVEQTTSFDLFISTSLEQNFDDYQPLLDSLPVSTEWSYDLYLSQSSQLTRYCDINTEYFLYYGADTVMKYSDYAALREMLGYQAVALEDGQCLIHCGAYLEDLMEDYSQAIAVNGTVLEKSGVYSEFFNQYLWDGNGQGFVVVVPDEAAEGCLPAHHTYAAMTSEKISAEQWQALERIRSSRPDYDTLYVKSQVETEHAAMTALFCFPLYYLALILTITAAAILTIQQLSETDRYRQQFSLLWKLGMERQEMVKALRTQLALFYAMPAVPPVLIAVPFILNFGGAVEPGILVGDSTPPAIAAITLALFFLIYAVYILLTYTSLKQNVLPDGIYRNSKQTA